MTTRGESTADPRGAEPGTEPETESRPAHAPAHAAPAGNRPRRGSRRAALIGLLVVSAGIATWAEVHYTGASSAAAGTGTTEVSQDGIGGVAAPGDASGSGSATAQGVLPDPSTIAPPTQNVPVSATNPSAYQETRYALGSAASCLGVMAPSVPNAVLSSCEGYLTADYLSADHSVLSQVTLFTFADEHAASRAESALDSAASVAMRQPGNAVPGVTAPTAATQWKVAQVGRFVTVVHSAYATQAVGATADLVTPTWYLTAQTADAVMWDD